MTSPIKWHNYDYTLQDLESFGTYYMPCVVQISQGYCGYGEDFYTFSTDEVYHIERLDTQTRVVAKEEGGRLYSIPLAYPLKFKVTSHKDKGKKAMYLEEILTLHPDFTTNRLTIVPQDDKKIKFWTGGDRRSHIQFGQLQVKSTYEDKYFIANSYLSGKLWEGIIMPLFLNIKLRMAEEVKGSGRDGLRDLMCWMEKDIGDKNKDVAGNKEIIVFENDLPEDEIYDYVKPSAYLTCNQVTKLRPDVVYQTPVNRNYTELGSGYTALEKTKQDDFVPEAEGDIYSEIGVEALNITSRSTTKIEPPLPPEVRPKGVKGLAAALHMKFPGSPQLPRKKPPPTPARMGGSLRVTKRELPEPPSNDHTWAQMREKDPKPPAVKSFTQSVSLDPKPQATAADTRSMTHSVSLDTAIETNVKRHIEDPYHLGEEIYKDYEDIPKSIKKMTKREVADCLRLLHLEKYIEMFLEKDVDGELLLELDEDLLKDEFTMTPFDAKKLCKFAQKGWRPK